MFDLVQVCMPELDWVCVLKGRPGSITYTACMLAINLI
jgi:hypothetical protein